MKKNLNLIKKITFGLLSLTICVFTFSIGTDDLVSSKNKIILSADTWKSELVEIKSYTDSNNIKFVDISELVELDKDGLVTAVKDPTTEIDANTKIIINDGLGIYYFSEICNEEFANGTANAYYQTYLSSKYILGANIDYEDASKTFKMLRPVGWKEGIPFSGEFDGDGHTVSNIFYRPFDNEQEVVNDYPGMVYLSWFSQNTGTIKNIGIINPNIIQYDIYDHAIFVSPFVGANDGIIENCYVQDLRGNESGISAEGGYEISMFVSFNNDKGIIRNCYTASNRISATSVTMSDSGHRHPFVAQNNNATGITNCYFDSEALTKYTTYDTALISGVTALTTAEFLDTAKFKYTDNSDKQIWFSNATYPTTFAAYLKITYPVLSGFAVDNDGYFVIEKTSQFIYMSELIDEYQIFREAKYLLANTVDLKTVKPNSYVFTQKVFSGTIKGGPKGNSNYNVTLADGSISQKNSILNLEINQGNSYQGYRCYGLFSVLNGTVENINIVNATITEYDIETVNMNEINTVGTVCGLMIGGNIKDVDVYSTISMEQEKDSPTFLGAQYVGGIAGTATAGKIEASTASGTIKASTYTPTSNSMAEELSHSIGGILGKALGNDGVSNCLNNISITGINYTSNPGNSIKQYLGGVIGSGHIKNTFELQNNANITVGSISTGTYYSLVYVGGIIGRVSNAEESNGVYNNNANIRYYVNDNNYKAYISGVMNVIDEEIAPYDTFNTTETYANIQNLINNQTPYEFTSLTSGGTLYIENYLSATKYPAKYQVITTINNGIDIRAAGLVYSYLTKINVVGAYNLNDHYEWDNGKLNKVENDPQFIDISMMDEFAPTFNADNMVTYLNRNLHLDTNYLHSTSDVFDINSTKLMSTINLERVYNYRNVNYITNKIVNSYMLQLSGCINGRNFNLKNIRNDGDIKVYFTENTYSNMTMNNGTYYDYFGDFKKLKVYGVMEEVSLNHTAKDIYNGGNITVSSDGTTNRYLSNFNLYIGGICYKNVGNDPAAEQELMIESGYVGSLHNSINNGEIRVTSGNILTSTQTQAGAFYGVSRIGGICAFNASTISSTFNLGNIYNINYIFSTDGTGGGYSANFEVETGGFCFGQQNEVYNAAGDYTRASIIDSANNGTIVSLNTRNSNVTWVNASGFVARNDRCEDGETVDNTETSKNPHEQKIEYSINYGDIYSYNSYANDNITGSSEPQSKAAGFVCLGACTIVDVINYGNIYCSAIAGGMYGIVYFDRMRNAGASQNSPIYIANSINYGKVDIISRTDTNRNALYTINKGANTLTLVNAHTTSANSTHYPVGALIGMLRSNNNQNDLYALNIKNLVNFYDSVDIIGRVYQMYQYPETQIRVDTLEYMATTKTADYSPAPFNTDRTNYNYGIKAYSKDTATGNPNLTNKWSKECNGGIFNESYTLRTPPAYVDENGNVVTEIALADKNNTDNFIADYIQFVPYSKVNDYLVQKIGLKDTVLKNAWDLAVNSTSVIKSIIEIKNKNNTGSLQDIYEELVENEEAKLISSKQEIIQIFANEIKKGSITSSDLNNIINILTNNGNDLSNLSNDSLNNIYSDLLLDSDLLNTQIGSENKTVLDVLYEYLVENKDSFVTAEGDTNDPINSILGNFADQASSDAEKQLVINIFSSLINDDDTLQNYLDSLSQAEKEELANRIYPYVMTNDEVIRAIGEEYYDSLNITTSDELNTLVTNLITARRNSNSTLTDYPITDEEYIDMYNSFYVENYTNAQVQTAINNLTNAQLRTFIDSINAGVSDTSSNLYQFMDSGRNNSTGIILPATSTNYVAVVNSTTGVYSSGSTAGTGEIYSGSYSTIASATPNNKYEVLIVEDDYYTTQNYGSTYNYWTYDNSTYRGQSNRWLPDNDTYYGILYSGQANTLNGGLTFISTGVYATRAQANNGGFGQPTRYNYSAIQVCTFIDYGSSAIAKNDGDLTKVALSQMLTYANNNQNTTYLQTYLYNMYVNSQTTTGKSEFLKLLFGDQTVSLNEALDYIQNEATNAVATDVENYANYILDNVSDTLSQGNIVKLFKGTNGSNYTNVLFEMIRAYDASNYELVKDLVDDLYELRTGLTNSQRTNINNNIVDILSDDSITNQDKLDVINYYSDDSTKEYAVSYLIKNGLLNDEQLSNTLLELLNSDITLLQNQSINQYLNDEIFSSVIAVLIKGDEDLFKQYTGLTSSTTIIEDLENLGIDSAIVTDNTGIYALASSHGILNGLFLPDNIELIKMDYYYEDDENNLVNDPTWRGGTTDNPNYYDENNTTCVNYKVYYEMKQLKKSIATIIFNMELVDETVDDNGEQLEYENVLTNNPETDYICNEKDQYGSLVNEVYFYVPINHNILSKDKIYINMILGSYELSYGATFDTDTDKLEITVPDTLSVGQKLSDTFVVQAEDDKVKTEYTLYIVITKASYLDPVNSVSANGANATYTEIDTTPVDSDVVTTDVIVTTDVLGYNGVLRVTYGTVNLINRSNLLQYVNVYKTEGTDIKAALENKELLILDENYYFNNVLNNGIVVIPNYDEDDTGFNSQTNGYDNGTVFFDLSIDNNMPGGTYLIEISLSKTTKYYVLFDKAKSTNSQLESITYNGQTFINSVDGTDNSASHAKHAYGTVLTESDLKSITEGKPNYLDEIVIAPLATYVIDSVTVTEDAGVKTYQIVYTVTAEDGVSESTFTHYISEDTYNTNIQKVYINGGIVINEEITKPDSGYVYTDSFAKDETPSYKFEYDLSGFYTTLNSEYFNVVFYDEAGVEIKDETTLELLNSYYSINIIEGVSFEVSFYQEAESLAYYFGLVYGNKVTFSNGNDISWNVKFDIVELIKLKNTNSYFDNVTFLSESVVSSIRTMITIEDISIEDYTKMLSDPTREIVSLPGQIHYNKYAIETNKQDAFYMIGLVNKTQLDYYMPTFDLPDGASVYRTETINGAIYKYVPYYIDNQQELTAFLISEDGNTILDSLGNQIAVTVNGNQIVYDGKTYTLSPVVGQQYVEVMINDVLTTIENTTLRTNYNEQGCYDEDKEVFTYVNYRVYSEIYEYGHDEYETNKYYTDYHVATQDLTNNIRFSIIIDYEEGCTIVDAVYNVYVEFTCYALPEGKSSDNRSDFLLYNRAGLFAYFDEDRILEHGTLQSNISGWYGVYVALSEGYTYSFEVTDRGKTTSYTEGDEFLIGSSITARTVSIHITITNASIEDEDWGVHVKDESFIKPTA